MKVDFAVPVRLGDLVRIDVFEPVIRGNGPAVVENEPASE